MEEIELTSGQLQILLNMTEQDRHAEPTAHLVGALHRARVSSHKWSAKMTEQDIETALALFMNHQGNIRTSAAQQAVRFFVRDSPTAYRFYIARRTQGDVPRETSGDE